MKTDFPNRMFFAPESASGSEEKPQKSLAEQLNYDQLTFRDPDGGTLGFCQRVFHSESDKRKPALLLFLHGAGERGNDNSKQLFWGGKDCVRYLTAVPMNCVLIFPQCPEEAQWVDTPWADLSHTMNAEPSVNMAHAMKLLDAKIKEFDVDPDRIYVMGISMGGYGTWDIICRRPDLFAAAVPICGGADLAQAPKLLHIPLRVYHGTIDGAVPTVRSDNMVKALRDAGHKELQYHRFYSVGHDVWKQAFQDSDTFDWIFSHTKASR